MNEEEDPPELTERQLDVIVAGIWVGFTTFVVLSVFHPYLAVGYLILRWAYLAIRNRVWSVGHGE